MTLLRSKTDYYQVVEELGRGTFGKVLKALKKETGEPVAIKVIRNDQIRSRVIKNEIKLLNVLQKVDLDKFHLISFFEYFHIQDNFYLVFELLQQSLYDYQKKIRFAPIPIKHIRTITTQVLEALSKLKELSVIHCDLKPENIVLVDHVRYPFRVKVIDFGSASILSEVKHVREPYIQSRFYRAPEILLGLPFCEKLDMWSLGCIIAELHFGYPLYPGNSEYDQIRYICETQGLPDYHLLRAASKALFFFKYNVDAQRRIQWRIKTRAEYQVAARVQPVENRKYILKSLDHIEVLYTSKPNYTQQEVLAERSDLRNMVELMKRLLTWDPNKRINPNTALKHPFIAFQTPKTHYKDIRYKQITSEQGRYDATQQRPPGSLHSLRSPSCHQGQILNGEEVDNMVEQMNSLHIEQPTVETHLKVTDDASPHPESADLPNLQDPPQHKTPLHPDVGRDMAATPLDNYHTPKSSKSLQYSKSEMFYKNGSPISASKAQVEDQTTGKNPEKQSAAPPTGRVSDNSDDWETGTAKSNDGCKQEGMAALYGKYPMNRRRVARSHAEPSVAGDAIGLLSISVGQPH
ncbi:homeodomain-interacting protein kinase 4 [Leptodactylus fuscus]|uniref:homeodomain-interacting protein kinase 4 n=1 Tax=Leptodactylus fuscus TaxID=238119 RepID=UPI003F4E843B